LGDDARQILDQRLARGEIDLDQYHRLIEALGHDRPNSQTDMGASK
jgi:uncharacterized membrane protein